LLEPGLEIWLGEERVVVSERKGTADRPILKVQGIGDREAAKALGGAEIRVSGDALGPLAPGEHLVEDLIGAEVVDGERAVGRVRDVVLLPSVEALEVERDGQGPLLVPLIRDAVRSIDAERGRIDVRLEFLEETA
jgi:16S rRNA processing protein RimM